MTAPRYFWGEGFYCRYEGESSARDIWKGPNWTGPWEEREGQESERGRIEKTSRPREKNQEIQWPKWQIYIGMRERLEERKWSLVPGLGRFRIRDRMRSAEKSHRYWVESRPSCMFFSHTTNWLTSSLPSLLCFWMSSSFLKTWVGTQLEDWVYLVKCLLNNLRTKVQILSS